MGKSLPSATKLQEFAKIVSPHRLQTQKRAKPSSRIRVSAPETGKTGPARVESERGKQQKLMESSEGQQSQSETRVPLQQVVSDCVKRWFQDALKEAKAGDSGMQVLVGQMYYSGYGVPKDPQKGRAWMNRASKSRVLVWNLSEKHPGYNASESDSDKSKDDAK